MLMLVVLAVVALPAAIASCNRGYAMRFQGAMPILGTREAFIDFSDTGMSDVDMEVTIAMWVKWDDYDPAKHRELKLHNIDRFTESEFAQLGTVVSTPVLFVINSSTKMYSLSSLYYNGLHQAIASVGRRRAKTTSSSSPSTRSGDSCTESMWPTVTPIEM